MLLTEPFEVAVVIAAQVAEATGPMRTSLPSMFGPRTTGRPVGRRARLELGRDGDHAAPTRSSASITP